MKVWPKRKLLIEGAQSVVAGALLTLAVGVLFRLDLGFALLLGLAGTSVLLFWRLRKYLRRRTLVEQPFPIAWRQTLERCVAFYRDLDPAGRDRFETDVAIFLAEQRIYGQKGRPVDDEIRVLVAASAAMLSFGLPDWEWPRLRDIVIYPTAFDETYHTGDNERISGMVHSQGPIIFSARDLKHGFRNPEDAGNVGLHELAHVMDFASGDADGIPAGLSWIASAPWVQLVADRLRKVRRAECRQVLRAYAGTNEAEFFAVAVETFFEKPAQLRDRDPELYAMLSGYFRQDPAGAPSNAAEATDATRIPQGPQG